MSGEDEFVLEDVETIIKQALQATFSADTVYDPEKVNAWTNTMVEQSLRGLLGQNKPFKYVVTAIIVQKNGAGLHTAAGTFWDGKKDGAFCRARARAGFFLHHRPPPPSHNHATPFFFLIIPSGVCKVPWENGTMQVIVTVFALSTIPSPQAVGPPVTA